jgi:hypothetical protein
MTQKRVPTRTNGWVAHWLEILDAHGVQFLILDKQRDGDLLQRVRSRSGWSVDFEDKESVLFARVPVPEGAVSMEVG